ncbi:HAD-IA family hydrolase [Streptomyces sp. NPDC055089]
MRMQPLSVSTPLLLAFDLDNTLVDRDTAFRSAAAGFLSAQGLPPTDIDVVMELDQGGHAPRPVVSGALAKHWGIQEEVIAAFLHRGPARHITLDAEVRGALLAVRAAGVRCVIVTNGRGDQQREKIRAAGLEELVDAWVISEEVGSRKPDPEIFHAAAAAAGLPALERTRTWVIGDAAHTDIRGAVSLGLNCVWVSGGRPWQERTFWPTHVAGTVVEAIDHVLGVRPRLVRDRFPQAVASAEGRVPEVYRADAGEYRERLLAKVREGVGALLADGLEPTGAVERLAEVREVLDALAADLGLTEDLVNDVRRAFAEQLGDYSSHSVWTGRYILPDSGL